MSTEFFTRTPLIGAVVVVLALAVEVGASDLKVCTFSFHGPEEVAVFESRLPVEDFEFLDLSPPRRFGELGADIASSPATEVPVGERQWVKRACRSDVRCDVVVFSAEFAGGFFGQNGRSLSLQELEEASCQARCAGLFRAPREVFLLACNTLATKDDDLRGPDRYLQVLLDHDFDRPTAERVVAARYGPLGPTWREALRRVFMGVPRIYGFSSVAPTGQYTGPMLERYFSSVGDYSNHLERLERDGPPNRALAKAFDGTTLVETNGLGPLEPAAADRDLICALYNEGRPVIARLEIVKQLMNRSDLLAFMPSIQMFLNRHPADQMQGSEHRLLDEIRGNQGARKRIVDLVYQLDVSALRLDLAQFAVRMGWMTRQRFRALAIDTARHFLNRPSATDVVDVMCAVSKHEFVGDEFGSADLPDALFRDAEGVRLISCLAPRGDAVSVRLAAALDSQDPELRVWTAHALSRRLPLPRPALMKVMAHLRDPLPDVVERLRSIFKAQRPLAGDVRHALEVQAPELAAQVPKPAPARN